MLSKIALQQQHSITLLCEPVCFVIFNTLQHIC